MLPVARILPAQASSHKQENPALETSLLPHLKGCEKSDLLDPTKVDYATELWIKHRLNIYTIAKLMI